ncbi:MAG: hypothetical protein DMF06_14410 [Verrucomicrobia bacterium]|nr:MAG: hypothetical protein DMF06_14410 [Verrucomicrobiota bacterium]
MVHGRPTVQIAFGQSATTPSKKDSDVIRNLRSFFSPQKLWFFTRTRFGSMPNNTSRSVS